MNQLVDDVWKVYRVARHCAHHRPRIENIARRLMYLKQKDYTPVAVAPLPAVAATVDPPGCERRGASWEYNGGDHHPDTDLQQMGEVCLPQFSFYDHPLTLTTPLADDDRYHMPTTFPPPRAPQMAYPNPFAPPTPPAPIHPQTQPPQVPHRYGVYDHFNNGAMFGNNGTVNPTALAHALLAHPDPQFEFGDADLGFTTPLPLYVSLTELGAMLEATPARDKPRLLAKKLKPPTECLNCGTTKTPLWRRSPQGEPLCNACGLFLKLHGVVRPLSLKTDVIKKRQRRKDLVLKLKSASNLKDLEWLI